MNHKIGCNICNINISWQFLLQVSFDVVYEMPQDKQFNDVAIAIGVLSAFAILYSGFQSWTWNRRAGKLGIDFGTIAKFLLFMCNSLANAFFAVIFGFALWQLIFYKASFVLHEK